MFWSSKKAIPASQKERCALAKKLHLMRLDEDSSARLAAIAWGVNSSTLTGEDLFRMGSPESIIIAMVEHFYSIRDKGLDENGAVQTLSKYFGKISLADGTYPPEVPAGTNFIMYLRHFIDALTRGGISMSDEMLSTYVIEIKKFYQR